MTLFYQNPILNTDFYKTSHWLQYPPGTKNVSSYIEARKGARFDEVVFFGLKWYLQNYLTQDVTYEDIDQAEHFITLAGLPFNRDGWMHIVARHGGRLPLEIKALPEGTVVPAGIPLVQLEATDPECFWLTSYVETPLLRSVWYPTTVATYSRAVKQAIKSNLDITCDNVDAILPFMLQDFGARGVSTYEGSIVGGMAHLINFKGTDTAACLPFISALYGSQDAGYSAPASEHSTITSWGPERETEAYENMIDRFDRENGIVSNVSDSYDLWAAVRDIYGDALFQKISEMKGRLVIRPDSGDPVEVVSRLVRLLGDRFGFTENVKGYKVLNPKIRVLQGDGVDLQAISDILSSLRSDGWSGENVVFGMGGSLLQDHTRDELRFAMKANAIQDADDVWHDVYKKPVTDLSKASKAGRQIVAYDPERHQWTSAKRTDDNASLDRLQTVYADGLVLMEDHWEDIKARAEVA